jgi:hypothetical protein
MQKGSRKIDRVNILLLDHDIDLCGAVTYRYLVSSHLHFTLCQSLFCLDPFNVGVCHHLVGFLHIVGDTASRLGKQCNVNCLRDERRK